MRNTVKLEILDSADFEALSIDERRVRNHAAFDILGEVGEGLRTHVPQSELIYHDDGQPDVLFRGQHLYDGKGAHTFAEKQLHDYWAQPVKVQTGFIDGKSLDQHTRDFATQLIEELDEADIDIETDYISTTDTSFFLFVMGIGLAPHLDELIEKTQCRTLAIFDVNNEFLYHSLSVYDWASLIVRFHSEKRRILIAIDDDPDHIQARVQSAIRQFNPSGLDGTCIFTHYHHAAYKKALDELLRDGLKVGMMGLGFMWDELRMVAHSYKNLEAGGARVLKKREERLDIPAFIVANGPSLDESIDFIKKHQGDAVILACGSALDPLLVNGIKPDVLLMLEQGQGLLNDQRESAKLADISDIIFVGASNLYPGVMNFHKERILFFRPGLSSCPLFSQKSEQRPLGADPLVANAGTMFALSAGFREIYMFGVDVGAPSQEYHHSKHSQYSTRGIKYNFQFEETGRGNFGGKYLSTQVLLWSKKAIEVLIANNAAGRSVYNCSNGLLIEGAIPRHQSTLDIKKVENKKAIIQELINAFPYYAVEDFKTAWEKADILHAIPELIDKLIAALDGDLDDYGFMTKMMNHLEPGINTSTEAMVIRGTVFNILMVVYSALRRVKDHERMDDLQDIIRKVFTHTLRDFSTECDEWFASLVEDTMEWET